MQQNQDKKKKSLSEKLGISKSQRPDELVTETLTELKDIVSTMKEVFAEFEVGYENQLEEERSAWDKFSSKIPFLQSSDIKAQEHRKNRIKTNKSNLEGLEDNLAKLDMILNSSQGNFEAFGQQYMDLIAPGRKSDDEAIKELEDKMSIMQTNMVEAMGQLSGQIRVMKSALDNIAGQLDEQGVVLDGIDTKIDVLDTKMDKANDLIKKVSNQINNNRLLFLVGTTALVAMFASRFVMG
jgi:hypothetical protein